MYQNVATILRTDTAFVKERHNYLRSGVRATQRVASTGTRGFTADSASARVDFVSGDVRMR